MTEAQKQAERESNRLRMREKRRLLKLDPEKWNAHLQARRLKNYPHWTPERKAARLAKKRALYANRSEDERKKDKAYTDQIYARVKSRRNKAKRQRRKTDSQWRAEQLARSRNYYRQHREIYYVNVRKRNALKKAAEVNLQGMQDFVKAVKSKPSAICYYCQKRVPIADVHLDHIVPLIKGGMHAVENLCVSCSTCNRSKGAKPLIEWVRENASQQLLNL